MSNLLLLGDFFIRYYFKLPDFVVKKKSTHRLVKFLDHGFNMLMLLIMVQCHYSYSACGLGSDGTNRLVQLVQGMQHNKSKSEDGTLYGAKITGGGSGGTVCVIGRNSLRSSQQILEVSIHARGSKLVGT